MISTTSDNEKQSYKIFNAGKKLVGAFSAFGFRKKPQQHDIQN